MSVTCPSLSVPFSANDCLRKFPPSSCSLSPSLSPRALLFGTRFSSLPPPRCCYTLFTQNSPILFWARALSRRWTFGLSSHKPFGLSRPALSLFFDLVNATAVHITPSYFSANHPLPPCTQRHLVFRSFFFVCTLLTFFFFVLFFHEALFYGELPLVFDRQTPAVSILLFGNIENSFLCSFFCFFLLSLSLGRLFPFFCPAPLIR